MRAIERLAKLKGHKLVVSEGAFGRYYAHYENCEVKDGYFLKGEFGVGEDVIEACEDYLKKISGKTLVFNAMTDKREEVIVL